MPHPYSPSTQHLNLGEVFFDPVEAEDFPETILRYRNQTAAKTVGLEELSDEEWLSHFGRFKPLPDTANCGLPVIICNTQPLTNDQACAKN